MGLREDNDSRRRSGAVGRRDDSPSKNAGANKIKTTDDLAPKSSADAKDGDDDSPGHRRSPLVSTQRERMRSASDGNERARLFIGEELLRGIKDIEIETFRLVLRLCREERLAAVAVVHDLTLAAMFADRAVLMSDGRVQERGLPTDVLRADAIERVYGVAGVVVQPPVTGRPVGGRLRLWGFWWMAAFPGPG